MRRRREEEGGEKEDDNNKEQGEKYEDEGERKRKRDRTEIVFVTNALSTGAIAVPIETRWTIFCCWNKKKS